MHVSAERLLATATDVGFCGVLRLEWAGDRAGSGGEAVAGDGAGSGGEAVTAAFGMANRAYSVPHTPDLRFGMASITKGFTALAVGSLVSDGVLSFDTPAREYLGTDLPLVADTVTVGQLLNHTSGVADYWSDSDPEAPEYPAVPPALLADAEQYLPLLDGRPMVSEPGRVFAYNNGAFCVAAIIAQRASGVEFHELVQQRVFDAAGMTRSGFLRQDELPGDAAVGYLRAEGPRTNVLHLAVRGGGDGGAYSTAEDLGLFWRALMADEIVSSDVRQMMLTPTEPTPERLLDRPYGLGFWLGNGYLLRGADRGVSTWTHYDPADGSILTVLSNVTEGVWPLLHALRLR
ncbi:MAG: beta-lactamase family protein [Cellulomonadaceae bacterium]|jgi:CubicO group peptidase (beta-lactamase class C family)|nr:beta-lactamase family protein [Cellulomonadaceae bacterium]